MAVPFAKRLGPIGLGLTIADLVYDEVEQAFMVPAPYNPSFPNVGAGTVPFCPIPNKPPECYEVTASGCRSNTLVATPGQFFRLYVKGPRPDNGSMSAAGYSAVEGCGTFNTYSKSIYLNDIQPPALEPASDSVIEEKIEYSLNASGLGAQLLDELLSLGDVTAQLPSVTVLGDSSVAADTETTTQTDPSGTTSITTQKHYDLDYQGDKVTITERTVTTKTTPDNVTSTSTTIKTNPATQTASPPAGGNGGGGGDGSLLCNVFPNISACRELGTIENGSSIMLDLQNRDFSMSVDKPTASCPPPRMVNLSFTSFEISWQPVCNLATMIKPFVVALAWIGAVIFVFGAAGRFL